MLTFLAGSGIAVDAVRNVEDFEHCTMAETEAEVLVFEPAHTRNTGNILDRTFTAPNGAVA